MKNKLKNLPVSEICSVLHKGKPKDYKLRAQTHAVHELIYVDYGTLTMIASGQETKLEPGDCFIIPGDAPHRFHGEDKPYDFLDITFEGTLSEDISLRVIRITEQERKLLLDMKNENLSELPHFRGIVMCKMNELLLRLQRRCIVEQLAGSLSVQAGDYNLNYTETIISRALNFIEENYSRKIFVSDVSAHVGISASYLRQLLRQKTDKNFRAHLLEARIKNAKYFLREAPDNIQTVANRVGYTSVPRFSDAFKKLAGMTPLEYSRSLGLP